MIWNINFFDIIHIIHSRYYTFVLRHYAAIILSSFSAPLSVEIIINIHIEIIFPISCTLKIATGLFVLKLSDVAGDRNFLLSFRLHSPNIIILFVSLCSYICAANTSPHADLRVSDNDV